MVILQTKELTKHYSGETVVDHVNLSIKKGEIYGFLGNNGAGKTTTIRMLLGLIRPTSGEIHVFGKKSNKHRKEILRKIGCIIETPGFYKNLTAVENLEISAKILGIHKKTAIDEALECVGLKRDKKKPVGKYSLGMKQRLGIARAIMHNPELLILDEPTNGLDPAGIQEIRGTLIRLAKEKEITLFLSSHILSEVEQLADRVGILHEGKLLKEIDIKTLKSIQNQYLEIKVHDINEAARILETKGNLFSYEVLANDTIHIYEKLDQAFRINEILVKNGIKVNKLAVESSTLESYFLKLTKGVVQC